MILQDFDECINSTFDPFEVENVIPNFPKVGITCFSKKLMDRYIESFNGEKIAEISNANGKIPVFKIKYKNKEIVLFMSRVGAPACTVSYEEVLAMGLEKLIMFGTCGVLDSRIDDLAIIIPTSAIRDEGTSYHYMKSSDEIEVNQKYKKEFEEILNQNNISSIEGKVWTIDAPYRETRNKVLKRKEQGCICVDMECSAMSAVAKFRNKELFQFFYAADNLDSTKWDKRCLGNDDRLSEKEKIIYFALELATKM
ncbi:MAG: nucleoside phosphorylase [Bacilli bacterium]|nr:nucleoside phosphorylase [Bacilli bacterium]